ncbi:MAG: outer membrane beta-barrel protein [Prolixibacteraceae bacterium]
MKKILLTGIIIFAAIIIVNGQTEKGKVLFGGSSNLNFFTMKTESGSGGSNKSSGFNMSPYAGYFIANGLAAGAEIPIFHYWSDNYKTTSLGVGPFLKYYVGEKKVKPYLLGAIELRKSKNKMETDAFRSDYTYNNFIWKFGAGAGIFINENTALDLGLHYMHEDFKAKTKQETAYDKGDSRDLSLTIGFTFIL